MKKMVFALSLLGSLFANAAFADMDANANGFMTPRDLMANGSFSNIFLHNSQGATVTAYGLYVRRFALVNPGQSCASPTVMYPSADIPADNITAGAVVTPTAINAGQSAAIGNNYLYNMIFSANYYVRTNIPSSPPGCALPGCTWGTDFTAYNWCIYLGALGPVSTSGDYTSNIPPAASDASSTGLYNYNLIGNSSYIYLGPISCDDQTLTCSVATQQTQSF